MGKYSITRINTFLENPWKHWCKYVAGYKPLKNPEAEKYMDRGTVFHRAMELLSSSKGKIGFEEVIDKVKSEARQQGFLEEAEKGGLLAVSRYLDEYGKEAFENVSHTEYRLDYPLTGGNEFVGFIDAIIPNKDGSVTLVDYKTYSSAPQEDKMKYAIQADMYMYVATKLGFKVRGFRFDCINPKEVIKGRMYRFKRIEFRYNPYKAEEVFDNFCEMAYMLEEKGDSLRMYSIGEHMPDAYDYLYRVYIGEVAEDLDEYLAKWFEPFDEENLE